MNFLAKSLLTLTHQAGGILGPEMYVSPQGLSKYGAIVKDPSYYLAKADKDNWDKCSKTIAKFVPSGTPVMEYGPGDDGTVQKTARLVQALDSRGYTGVDLSSSALDQALEAITKIKGDIETTRLETDFWDDTFPNALDPTLSFFAGGSIENLEIPVQEMPPEQVLTKNLSKLARRTSRGWLLISIDAYSDDFPVEWYLKAYSSSVHESFNLGVFERMKTELNAEIDLDGFYYSPEFHHPSGAILHMAYAKRSQEIKVGSKRICIREGMGFHLQNSFRFTEKFFLDCAESAGLKSVNVWNHPSTSMQLHLLQDVVSVREAYGT